MKKIPTLYERNPDDRKRVILGLVTPGCEWVIEGEGIATYKFDGTCVMLDEHGAWWARREVKPGKTTPPNFLVVHHDETTGKTMGWEPMDQSAWAKWHADALHWQDGSISGDYAPGTYELCGPKVNGNPEGYEHHALRRHAEAMEFPCPDRGTSDIVAVVLAVGRAGGEGIVFHHPDGRMAKLKVRDLPTLNLEDNE